LINNIELPDIEDDDGNYMKDNSFEIKESTEHVEFFTDVTNNAVVLANRKVSAVARSGKFRYKVAPLIVAKGHAEVDMNTVDIEVGLSFATTVSADGRVIPRVSAVDVKCDINRFDINIKLFGDLITDFASLFEVFFVGTVAGLIEDTITVTLNKGIPFVSNAIMGRMDGYFPVPLIPNWVIDWQTPEAVQVTAAQVAVGIKCLFFDKSIGEEEPSVAIPDMPYHSTSHLEKFQTYLSAYTIDGFFGSLLEVSELKGWSKYDAGPKDVTTTSLDALLPGIVAYYGAGQPVDTFFQVWSLGDF
jgi:hypothetical protein